MLAGIGSMAYTYEKGTQIVDDLVQKGKITIEEGKELSQELKRTNMSTNNMNTSTNTHPITKEEMVDLIKQMNFATQADLDDIRQRLTKLEVQD
jgi:polyhydroxyalkanoate synthesis regulator phasin